MKSWKSFRKIVTFILPDDNCRDRNKRDDRPHFNRNSANRLHMGPESTARVKWL